MSLSDQKLEEFKELLQKRAADITSGTVNTRDGMHDSESLFADPLDRASLESNRNFTLRLRDRERKLLKKINEALGRIAAGTFGLCNECGEPIEPGRLHARPVTTLCIDCKEEQERIEKMDL